MEAAQVDSPSKDRWFVVLVTDGYLAEAGSLLFLHKPTPHSHFVLIADTDNENQPDIYSSFVATECLRAAGLAVAERMWLSDPDLFATLAENSKAELPLALAELLWEHLKQVLSTKRGNEKP